MLYSRIYILSDFTCVKMLPRVGPISFKKKFKCVDNFSLWLVASFRRLEGVELNEQHAVDDPDKVADEVSTLVQM